MTDTNCNTFNIKGKTFIFIHIPKTGGTSILHKIHNFMNITDFTIKHTLASSYESNIWESAISFCVIRNPFDRLVSHWAYHTTATDSKLLSILGISEPNKLSFREYFDLVEKHNYEVINWRPMSEYIKHPSKKIDEILRFEILEKDWKKSSISKMFSANLPHIKKSDHVHYSYYYTPELIDRVSKFYKDDLLQFKYFFEKKINYNENNNYCRNRY